MQSNSTVEYRTMPVKTETSRYCKADSCISAIRPPFTAISINSNTNPQKAPIRVPMVLFFPIFLVLSV